MNPNIFLSALRLWGEAVGDVCGGDGAPKGYIQEPLRLQAASPAVSHIVEAPWEPLI